MKTIANMRALITTILLLSVWHISTAQEVNPGDIIGSWTFQQGPSFARILPDHKEQLDADPTLKSRVFAGYIDRVLTFNEDGSFSQRDGSGRQLMGSWKLQGNVLTIIDDTGNQWVQQIDRLNQNQLVLNQIDQGAAKPLVPQLYFFKA